MKKCEMLEAGNAYELPLSEGTRRDIALESGYIFPAEGKGTVICEIPKGECPYENEGRRMYYDDGDDNLNSGLVCVCISGGFVEKAGLLRIEITEKRDLRRFRSF